MTICSPKGRSDRHRSSDERLTNQRVFEPIVEEECQDDTLAPVKPMPKISAVIVKNIENSVEEEDHYFKPRSQSPEDGEHTPVEYPPPLTTPASKPMVIGAAIARFYDMATSETSASLPHPKPSAYYNRRHEEEKEKLRELSRNNSSGGIGRVPLSRIRALQEKLVPESNDETERVRSNRRLLLNPILADAPSPSPQSTPAPIQAAPPPPTPPPPPPLRPTGISRASTAALEMEMERKRERRRKQLNESRGPETAAISVPPPPPPQNHAQRLARTRPTTLSLKDPTHAHGVEKGMWRGPAYSGRV
jgi:hypothetical protein